MTVDIQAIETKLAAARTRLILDKPFLGALVLRLPMNPAEPDWCPTTATDARAFYYNPEYIRQLSIEQTQFMLAHEALHCALSHFARRRHRVRHKWDLSCDYAVNPLLIDAGLTPPPEALHIPLYKGMTAEEIYPLIEDNDASRTLDKHAYDRDNRSWGRDSGLREDDLTDRPLATDPPDGELGGGTQARPEPESGGGAAEPEPLQPDEQETLNVQWQQRLAGAAQQAMQAGKLGGELARMIDHLLQPQLPWRMLLARYMTAAARDDYSYMRPSRREGDFILPTLRSHQLQLVMAVDTSGSIKARELAEFIPATPSSAQARPGSSSPGRNSRHPMQSRAAAAPAFGPCSIGSSVWVCAPTFWSTSPTPKAISHPRRRTTPSSGWSRAVRRYLGDNAFS